MECSIQQQHLLPKVYVYIFFFNVLCLFAQCAYPPWGRSKSRRSSWLNWRAAWHARKMKIFQTLAQPMTGRPASIVYAASSCSSLAGRVPDHLRAFARAGAATHPDRTCGRKSDKLQKPSFFYPKAAPPWQQFGSRCLDILESFDFLSPSPFLGS